MWLGMALVCTSSREEELFQSALDQGAVEARTTFPGRYGQLLPGCLESDQQGLNAIEKLQRTIEL
jgi:hypothetical protein